MKDSRTCSMRCVGVLVWQRRFVRTDFGIGQLRRFFKRAADLKMR